MVPLTWPFHFVHDLVLQAVYACCNMKANVTHNSLASILHWLSLWQHRNVQCVFVWRVRYCLGLTTLFFTLPLHLQEWGNSTSVHTVQISYPFSFQLHSFKLKKAIIMNKWR